MQAWRSDDALGSTYVLTDDAENVLEVYSYDIYGQPSFYDASGTEKPAGDILTQFLWRGMRYCSYCGFYLGVALCYIPEAGRYTSRRATLLEHWDYPHYSIVRPATGSALWPYAAVTTKPVVAQHQERKRRIRIPLEFVQLDRQLRRYQEKRVIQREDVSAWIQGGKRAIDAYIQGAVARERRLTTLYACCIPQQLEYVDLPGKRICEKDSRDNTRYLNRVSHNYRARGQVVACWIMQGVFDIFQERLLERTGKQDRYRITYIPRIPDWRPVAFRETRPGIEIEHISDLYFVQGLNAQGLVQVVDRPGTQAYVLTDQFRSPNRLPFRTRIYAKAALLSPRGPITAETYVIQTSIDFDPNIPQGGNQRRNQWP